MTKENPRIAYTVFVEDKPYLLWQLELFLFSLTRRGGVDEKDIFLFWADPFYYGDLDNLQFSETAKPSEWLQGILDNYNIRSSYCNNFGKQNRTFRFIEGGGWYGQNYNPINKLASVFEWHSNDAFKDYDEICWLEQDLWFSDKFPKLPKGNCITQNWIPNPKALFEKSETIDLEEFAKQRGFTSPRFEGLKVNEILKLCGVTPANRKKYTQGAVIFKIKKEDLTTKFMCDTMNFCYMLLHLGEIANPNGKFYESEMIAPLLASCSNGIKLRRVDDAQWKTEVWWLHETYEEENTIPKGTVVHYGWHFKDHTHLAKKDFISFGKGDFPDTAPWQSTSSYLDDCISNSKYVWVENFFKDMKSIKSEHNAIIRRCEKIDKSIKI